MEVDREYARGGGDATVPIAFEGGVHQVQQAGGVDQEAGTPHLPAGRTGSIPTAQGGGTLGEAV